MKKILGIIILIFVAICLVNIVIQKRFYKTISQETLVATIKCAKSKDKDYDFYLFYFSPKRNKLSNVKLIKMKGDDWAFEGEIIKWKKPLNLMGLKTIQRPIRIYDSHENCYLLEKKLKKVAFQIGKLLPLVDASFTSIIKQRFKPKVEFGIFVTNSGYLVRKIR
ncbi:MAG: hypothetical protein NC828_01025 [Candidatus Omnitrophica bacterium]|nr:hypothetical protein [Candidatus Omnitrophota bacterium]